MDRPPINSSLLVLSLANLRSPQRQFLFSPLVQAHRCNMATKYIIGSLAASFAVAYACDYIIADKKIFGGTTPSTVSNKQWWEETDKKFQAWPRVAGPPVVMNPISRQNFIVKSNP